MRSLGAIAAACLLSLLLAGCSQPPAAAPADDGPHLEATATTGVLRGVVVDEAIRPLGNVTVKVAGAGSDRTATTGADGLFGFQDLSPGAYTVTANKRAYPTMQQVAEVRAGVADPPMVKFQLTFEKDQAPFEETLKWDGFVECAATGANYCALPNIYSCVVQSPACGNYTDDDSARLFYDDYASLQRVPDWGQWETYWESTQSLTDWLCIRFGASDPTNISLGIRTTVWDTVCGGSPIVYSRDHETLTEAKIGTAEGMNFEFFTGGEQTLCGAKIACGVGATMQQRFSMFMFNFYGYAPPEGWTFAATQEVPPPPT